MYRNIDSVTLKKNIEQLMIQCDVEQKIPVITFDGHGGPGATLRLRDMKCFPFSTLVKWSQNTHMCVVLNTCEAGNAIFQKNVSHLTIVTSCQSDEQAWEGGNSVTSVFWQRMLGHSVTHKCPRCKNRSIKTCNHWATPCMRKSNILYKFSNVSNQFERFGKIVRL